MSEHTITEFLEARIAEDEAEVQAALLLRGSGTHWRIGHPLDPARVLAECAAKRAIMSHYTEAVKWARDPDCPAVQSYTDIAVGLGESILHLAAVYSSHADYQQEWAL